MIPDQVRSAPPPPKINPEEIKFVNEQNTKKAKENSIRGKVTSNLIVPSKGSAPKPPPIIAKDVDRITKKLTRDGL